MLAEIISIETVLHWAEKLPFHHIISAWMHTCWDYSHGYLNSFIAQKALTEKYGEANKKTFKIIESELSNSLDGPLFGTRQVFAFQR